MALVIKQWKHSNAPDENGRYVEIVGRESGLLAWLLALLGADPTTRVVVTAEECIFETTSLIGKRQIYLPLAKVSSAYYGYVRPWAKALIFFLLAVPFLSALGLGIGGILLGGWTGSWVFAGLFWLFFSAKTLMWFLQSKTMTLGVREAGGDRIGLEFGQSLLEGVVLDAQAAKEASLVIGGLIRSKN